ncbi:MAG: VPLPA-CTERM sorting domain-containing protein, partial [Pseudomonadota bacterium]
AFSVGGGLGYDAAFRLSYDGLGPLGEDGAISLTMGRWDGSFDAAGEPGFVDPLSTSASSQYRAMADMTTMMIRTRSNQGAGSKAGATALRALRFFGGGQAHDVGDNAPAAGGSAGTAYIVLEDFDYALAWSLTGVAEYRWSAGEFPNQSRLNHTFKMTTVPPVTDVPLPAAGWLLLAGLGALAARRRRG